MTIIIETKRLILRTWKQEDAEAYYQINQDTAVLELIPGPLTHKYLHKYVFGRKSQKIFQFFNVISFEHIQCIQQCSKTC